MKRPKFIFIFPSSLIEHVDIIVKTSPCPPISQETLAEFSRTPYFESDLVDMLAPVIRDAEAAAKERAERQAAKVLRARARKSPK